MNSIETLRPELVDLALQVAANEGKDLDFSEASVVVVEALLAGFHEYYLQSRSEDGLFGIALEFGAYLIEVIERHYPPKGRWRRDDGVIGKETFPYQWRSKTIFPVAWCQKRIFDGPADDITLKWDAFVRQSVGSGG